MASVIQICNMALARIGNSNPIASLTEASTQARQCNAHYEQVRDEVLQAYPWGFASKRVLLSPIDEDLVTNWAYCYSYPSDCLRMFALVSEGTRNPTIAEALEYEVASYNDLRVILSDVESAEAYYVYRVTDPAQFPPLVVKAIADNLAARIDRPITGKDDPGLDAIAFRSLSEAAMMDMNESQPGEDPDCDLITSRE